MPHQNNPMGDHDAGDDAATVIITMDDMAAVFAVTDAFGIHRESVSVELAKADPGAVSVAGDGAIDITLPVSVPAGDFAAAIHAELTSCGYGLNPDAIVVNEAADEDDDDWLA